MSTAPRHAMPPRRASTRRRRGPVLFAALGLTAGILGALLIGSALSSPQGAGAADAPIAVECGVSPGLDAVPTTARGYLKVTLGSTAYAAGVLSVRHDLGPMALPATPCPPVAAGGGGATGKSGITPIVVVKRLDSLSLPLTNMAMRGTHTQTMTLDMRRLAGTAEGPYQRMTLTDVTVGRVRNAWAKGGTVEEVSLLPAKVRWDSYPSLTSTAPTQTTCWNIPANTPTC